MKYGNEKAIYQKDIAEEIKNRKCIKVHNSIIISQNNAVVDFVVGSYEVFKKYDTLNYSSDLRFFAIRLEENCNIIIKAKNCTIQGVVPDSTRVIDNGVNSIIGIKTKTSLIIRDYLDKFDSSLTDFYLESKFDIGVLKFYNVNFIDFNRVRKYFRNNREYSSVLGFIASYIDGDINVIRIGLLTEILNKIGLDGNDLDISWLSMCADEDYKIQASLVIYGMLRGIMKGKFRR